MFHTEPVMQSWVKCDHPGCDHAVVVPEKLTQEQIREVAAQYGMVHVNGKDFCPFHAVPKE